MHFSTIPVSLALAVGMTAAAGPVVDRDNVTSLKAVEVPTGGAPPPNGGSDEVVVTGAGGKTVSRRGDFNPPDERAYAALILCPRRGWRGYCYGYNLSHYQFNKCYFTRHPFCPSTSTPPMASVTESMSAGTTAVTTMVCISITIYSSTLSDILQQGVLIRRVRTCYNVYPSGSRSTDRL